MHNALIQLNEQFGIKNQLYFELENDFFMIIVDNKYAKAKISVYGGQVLSYLPANQTEDLLFLSEKAIYQQGKAIRGGIPICWPWFADDTSGFGRPAHGFARNQQWNVLATDGNADGSTRVVLALQHNDDSIAVWPYEFQLKLEITIGPTLNIKLTTNNIGGESFDITQALHAYLNIGDVRAVSVADLDGIAYIDKTDDFVQKLQSGNLVVSGETDRVYQSPPSKLVVNDSALNRKLTLESIGCKTAVIWNPWDKIAASMADVQDEDYKVFMGVEAANADGDVITVAAGASHCLQANYSIIAN
ncbi:MAG: D-hexose-6-phosphate mutarotase [Methylophagaceae bacterium]